MKTKPKTGRPRRSAEEPSATRCLRATDAEWDQIVAAAAERQGVSVSAWLRKMAARAVRKNRP